MLQLLAFALINLLGAMSPGPDFAIVARYGFTGSRRSAFRACFGVSAALLIHVTYCLFGVALILQEVPSIYHVIQATGAVYLLYLGVKLILESKTKSSAPHLQGKHNPFIQGFLTNLLNPKAALFILSLFTQFINPSMGLPLRLAYGITVPLMALTWFLSLSYLLTHPKLFSLFKQRQKLFSRLMGSFLILLALYVLWELAKF